MTCTRPLLQLLSRFTRTYIKSSVRVTVRWTILILTSPRRHFSGTRKPFAIVLAGMLHYVITSHSSAHLVYSKPLVFNFDYFLSKALSGFGVDPARLDAFWQKRSPSQGNPKGKCLVHVTEDIYKYALLSGPHLSDLLRNHKVALKYCLSFKQLATRWGLATVTQTKPISLYTLCTTTMVESMHSCLFDPIIKSIEPEMTTGMMEFTDDLWK